MSAGGVFQIIANDGKVDAMIMATSLLNRRLIEIKQIRTQQNEKIIMPSLADIERTHILFVNSHFKPYCTIASEYNRVKSTSGIPQFGGSVNFNIPIFGDFFADMVCNVQLNAATCTVGTVPSLPVPVTAVNISARNAAGAPIASPLVTQNSIAGTGSMTSGKIDATAKTYTSYTYSYVDSNDVVQAVGAPAKNFIRYCEYPGERLFTKVKFSVTGNPLDEYTTESTCFFRKYKIPPNKLVGWKRLMGQEVAIEAIGDLSLIAGVSQFSASATNLVSSVNTLPARGAMQSAGDSVRRVHKVYNGPQTPKDTQTAMDLWVPILFWFQDFRLAIPAVSIPYGDRFIQIDIAPLTDMLFATPGNLFLRLVVEESVDAAATLTGIETAISIRQVNRWTTRTPVLAAGSVVDPTTQVKNMELYINNLFVNPEIHDIYIHRVGFNLIRVRREQRSTLSNATDSILMSQLKWPTETIYVGFKPKINQDNANPNKARDWHKFMVCRDETFSLRSQSTVRVPQDQLTGMAASVVVSQQDQGERVTYTKFADTINTLEVKAHGVSFISNFKTKFFNTYVPYTYGGCNIMVPEDEGVLMVNFCLYPGSYQPSGYINLSRAREFYINYDSSYISPATPVDMVAISDSINFLLISDGSAVLRYTT